VARFKIGVLGHEDSVAKDSLGGEGFLEAPLFTRPRSFEDMEVPEVLLSGDHQRVDRWKYLMGLYRTFTKRPDLWKSLIEKDQKFLNDLAEAKEEVSRLSEAERRACGISSGEIS
jgi:tRNA (guanine37-N1)-methyltransferase